MRRPQSAFGLAAVIASLLVVTQTPAPGFASTTPSAVPEKCTGHRSTKVPPRTIRVLRTKRSATPKKVAGTVQEVDFRRYVGVVMAAEWPEHYPIETLKAGAIAVKQYGWFYTRLYRGKTVKVDGKRVCYDVIDNTIDQVYYPEARTASAKHNKAINSTWDVTLRKYRSPPPSSVFFLTGYRAGTSTNCGADANGWKLYQHSARRCGLDGMSFRKILYTYLNPRLELATHGRHDIIGSKRGDAAAMVKDGNELAAHVWTPGSKPPKPSSKAGLSIYTPDLVGYRASDVDRDGRDDLVWVKKTAGRDGRVRVALAGRTGYGESSIWFEGDLKVPLASARLLAGDFDADGRRDVALLGAAEADGKAVLYVLRKKNADAFEAPTRWWSGPLDLGAVRGAWAADVTGDGYADLMVRDETAGGGVRIKVAVNDASGSIGELKARFASETLPSSKVKMVAADANRDGRDDVLMLVWGNGSPKVQRLQGQPRGGFKRISMGKVPGSDPVLVKSTRLGAADVDYDGRADLVLFTKRGDGTSIRVLKSRYESTKAGPTSFHAALDWADIRPY